MTFPFFLIGLGDNFGFGYRKTQFKISLFSELKNRGRERELGNAI